MSARLRLIEPSNNIRSVAPGRATNAELRAREYLTPAEVEKLAKAARDGRHGHRDATMILIAFRHGLRAIEICDLEWSPGGVRSQRRAACQASQERQAERSSPTR